MRSRSSSNPAYVALFVLSVLSLAWLGANQRGACFQSPIPTTVRPTMPGVSPVKSYPMPAQGTRRLLNESFWSSPLPWVVVGVVLFGAWAWVLITLLSHLEPRDT